MAEELERALTWLRDSRVLVLVLLLLMHVLWLLARAFAGPALSEDQAARKRRGAAAQPTERIAPLGGVDEGTPVFFPNENYAENLKLAAVGDNLYRVDSVPLLTETVSFKDVIRTVPMPGDRLRFVEVTVSSKWKIFRIFLPREQMELPRTQRVLEKVVARGGFWEVVVDGCLLMALPPRTGYDPEKDLQE